MTFENRSKQLILNQTNCQLIAGQFGPETDNWIGKEITLYSAKVTAFGKTHDAVRVREHVNTVSAAPDPVTPAQPDDVQREEDAALWNDPNPPYNPVNLEATADMQGSPRNREAIEKSNTQQREATEELHNDSGLDPDEIDLIESWGSSPPKAHTWAVDVGACENAFEARASWKKIIEENFDGVSLGPKDIPSVMVLFYYRQREKLQEQAGKELK